jgi:hypothetical protein
VADETFRIFELATDTYEMKEFLFWAVALGVPSVMWVINFILRGVEAVRTAGADWMLLLITFDFTAVASTSDFAKFVVSEEFRSAAGNLFLGVALVLLMLWIGTIRVLEPFVQRRKNAGASLQLQLSWYGVGWVFALTGTALNLFIFYHRTTT